ncbi:MAG: hypothetical protein HYW25_02095 [Candidatus Aenigmarchaeota archaeon]|nr:hypothetical protein [Candidatus Aenigmarchaeota archaeon]
MLERKRRIRERYQFDFGAEKKLYNALVADMLSYCGNWHKGEVLGKGKRRGLYFTINRWSLLSGWYFEGIELGAYDEDRVSAA